MFVIVLAVPWWDKGRGSVPKLSAVRICKGRKLTAVCRCLATASAVKQASVWPDLGWHEMNLVGLKHIRNTTFGKGGVEEARLCYDLG